MQKFPVQSLLSLKKITCHALVMAALFSISSCQKGETGPKGATGSANVVYSDWFTPAAYTVTTVFGIKDFDYTKAAPGITQTVLDSGIVLTYGKLLGYNTAVWPAGQVSQLPILLTYVQGTTQTDTWSALATVGSLRIDFVNSANFYTSISTSHSFRYIIIPGGVHGGRQMDFHSMTYAQVCDYLQIAP